MPAYGEHLGHTNPAGVERQRRPGHVEPPYPGAALAGEAHRTVPPGFEVGHPAAQRVRVVLTEVLDVADLEIAALDRGDDIADRQQLAVGKDVRVDEGAPGATFSGTPDDLVVQQSAPGNQQVVQRPGVVAPAFGTEVLGHPDARYGVERVVGQVAPVLHPDVDALGQAGVEDPLARVFGLLVGQRDSDRLDAVLAGRVDDQAAPSTAHVEQTHARAEAEL